MWRRGAVHCTPASAPDVCERTCPLAGPRSLNPHLCAAQTRDAALSRLRRSHGPLHGNFATVRDPSPPPPAGKMQPMNVNRVHSHMHTPSSSASVCIHVCTSRASVHATRRHFGCVTMFLRIATTWTGFHADAYARRARAQSFLPAHRVIACTRCLAASVSSLNSHHPSVLASATLTTRACCLHCIPRTPSNMHTGCDRELAAGRCRGSRWPLSPPTTSRPASPFCSVGCACMHRQRAKERAGVESSGALSRLPNARARMLATMPSTQAFQYLRARLPACLVVSRASFRPSNDLMMCVLV